ncbi:hypothetical protein ACXO6E_07600 [Lactobacillus delbrueckii subsp. bulgaricus]
MQVEFKQDKQLKEDQLIIKAKKLTPEIEAALAFLEEKLAQKITVYQGSDVIILPLTSILFFETSDRHVWAHDREGSHLVKQTLRQLEASLPSGPGFQECPGQLPANQCRQAVHYGLRAWLYRFLQEGLRLPPLLPNPDQPFARNEVSTMNKNRKSAVRWGLILIAIAIPLILSQLFPDYFTLFKLFNLSLGQVFWVLFLAWIAWTSFKNRALFFGIFASGLIVKTISEASHFFKWTGYMYLALFLIALGCKLLAGGSQLEVKMNVKTGKKDDDGTSLSYSESIGENGEKVSIESVFSKCVRYVHSQALRKLSVSTVMSPVTIYLDQTQLKDGRGKLDLDAVFSKVDIYIPREWEVQADDSPVFSRFTALNPSGLTADSPLLKIDADLVFSKVTIHRV